MRNYPMHKIYTEHVNQLHYSTHLNDGSHWLDHTLNITSQLDVHTVESTPGLRHKQLEQ